jgi:hypothetical protein
LPGLAWAFRRIGSIFPPGAVPLAWTRRLCLEQGCASDKIDESAHNVSEGIDVGSG